MLGNKSNTIKILLDNYKKSWGNASLACQYANIAQKTFYEWKKKDPKFRQKLEDADKYLVDRAKGFLGACVEDKSVQAIQFFLKNKAREEFGDRLNVDLEMRKYEELAGKIFGKGQKKG